MYPDISFPNSSVGKESACNAEDSSSIPGSGTYTGEGYPLQYSWAFLVAQLVKNLTAMQETCIRFQEKKKATHSSILAWRSRGLYSHGVTKSLTRLSDFHNNNMTSLEYV